MSFTSDSTVPVSSNHLSLSHLFTISNTSSREMKVTWGYIKKWPGVPFHLVFQYTWSSEYHRNVIKWSWQWLIHSECLLCARHFSKIFTYFNLFNHYNHLLSHLQMIGNSHKISNMSKKERMLHLVRTPSRAIVLCSLEGTLLSFTWCRKWDYWDYIPSWTKHSHIQDLL